MTPLQDLEAQLEKIEAQLADAEGRLPAHSVKPGQMAAFFQLEEERDALIEAIGKLRRNPAAEGEP